MIAMIFHTRFHINLQSTSAIVAEELMEAGDMEGVAVWKMILKAIKELLDKAPPGNQSSVH